MRPGPAHLAPAASAAPQTAAHAPAAADSKLPLSSALAAVSVSVGSDAAAAKAAAIIKEAEEKAAVIIKAAESAAAKTKAKVDADAKASADAQAKADAEAKTAAADKKAAADRAAAEANKADNAAAEPVHIGGATGTNSENVNGVYDPTSELSSGRRVYKRRDADIWIELFEGKWQIKPASGKGKDDCWAFFPEGRALEQCVGSTWQVYDGKAWGVQSLVKLLPESRAAFELVHMPFRQLFTAGPYKRADGCSLPFPVNGVVISPDFRFITLQAYSSHHICISTDTQEEKSFPAFTCSQKDFFSTSGRYYINLWWGTIFECQTGMEVTGTWQEECRKKLRPELRILGVSHDEKFVFYAYVPIHGRVEMHPLPKEKDQFFQVFRMTGELEWEFNLPKTKFMVCLPDNDTFIVHHSCSISKYSLSSRTCIRTVSCCEFPSVNIGQHARFSPDGAWVSFFNVVVDTYTLHAVTLPLRGIKRNPPRSLSGDTNAEGCAILQEIDVFFLPGSRTAICDCQVFSLVDGKWTLRMSPRFSQVFPMLTDEYYLSTHNLVTRQSGSDIFFSNVSFALVAGHHHRLFRVFLQEP
jgi:hypothetical protein